MNSASARGVCQPGGGNQLRGGVAGGAFHARPIARRFQPCQQPVAQRSLFQRAPRRRIPAALELGALDQGDVAVVLDQIDAALHDLAVDLGPAGGDLGDGRRAVALEPGRGLGAGGHASGQHDLECAFAKGGLGRRRVLVG
jgi:hypothetical protein